MLAKFPWSSSSSARIYSPSPKDSTSVVVTVLSVVSSVVLTENLLLVMLEQLRVSLAPSPSSCNRNRFALNPRLL